MAESDLYISLLRPPVLDILRAAGFHAAKPVACETLVDLAARYLSLLCRKTAQFAWLNHNSSCPDVTDVRMALQTVGALAPDVTAAQEQQRDEDDLRGLQALLAWAGGDMAREIARIADNNSDDRSEDYLTALKKKHSKTGEDSRFQGTVLGRDAEAQNLRIEGNTFDTIASWERQQRSLSTEEIEMSMTSASAMSTPLTDV